MGNVSGCYKNSDKNVIKTTSTETGNDNSGAQTLPARTDESQPDESSATKRNKSPKISSSYASTVSSDAPTRRNYGNYRHHNSDYNRPNVGPGIGMSGSMGGGFGGEMGGFGGGMEGFGGGMGEGGGCGMEGGGGCDGGGCY